MKKHDPVEEVCEKHFYLLCDVGSTEKWLNEKASQGWILTHVEDYRFYFRKTDPFICRYFLLNPETGTNSELWLYHEFQRFTKNTVPCIGSVKRALFVSEPVYSANVDMIQYFFHYRNYRIARRYAEYITAGIILIGIGTIAVAFLRAKAIAAMLQCFVLGLLLVLYNSLCFLRLSRINATHFRDLLKKPCRPGYEHD